MTSRRVSLEEFSQTLSTIPYLSPDNTIALAVSGGPDSLALLRLFAELKKYKVVAITIDHQLRDEARKEAEFVHKLCRTLGVEHHILTWEHPDDLKPKSNIQLKARQARYELMSNFCKSRGINFLATAHHFDDQLETIYMRQKKGSTLYGLAGMALLRPLGEDMSLIRPLLTFSKDQLIKTCEDYRQSFITDPSNINDMYERIQVRNELGHTPMPEREKLIALYQKAVQYRIKADRIICKLFKSVIITDYGTIKIELRATEQYEGEIRLLFFNHFFQKLSQKLHPIKQEKLTQFLTSIKMTARTFCGYYCSVQEREILELIPEKPAVQSLSHTDSFTFPHYQTYELNREIVGSGPLYIRALGNFPIKEFNTHIKETPFTKHRIRKYLPCIVDNQDHILLIPHLKLIRRDDRLVYDETITIEALHHSLSFRPSFYI